MQSRNRARTFLYMPSGTLWREGIHGCTGDLALHAAFTRIATSTAAVTATYERASSLTQMTPKSPQGGTHDNPCLMKGFLKCQYDSPCMRPSPW